MNTERNTAVAENVASDLQATTQTENERIKTRTATLQSTHLQLCRIRDGHWKIPQKRATELQKKDSQPGSRILSPTEDQPQIDQNFYRQLCVMTNVSNG